MKIDTMADALSRSSSKQTEWSGRLHAAGVVISAAAIGLLGAHLTSESFSAWLTVCGSTIIGCGLWLSRRAQRVNWRARFLRRRALLADSLGYGDALVEGLDLAADYLSDQHSWSAPEIDRSGYYLSKSTEGIMRLRDNLLESATWTEKLYRAAQKELTVRSSLELTAAIGMAMAIAFTGSGALDSTTIVQLISVALVFVVSSDQFDAIDKLGWASSEARRIRPMIAADPARAIDDTAVVRMWEAFADYAVLTSIAPAIPHRLYQRHRVKLDALSAVILNSERKT
jgi:hypothetical protein